VPPPTVVRGAPADGDDPIAGVMRKDLSQERAQQESWFGFVRADAGHQRRRSRALAPSASGLRTIGFAAITWRRRICCARIRHSPSARPKSALEQRLHDL